MILSLVLIALGAPLRTLPAHPRLLWPGAATAAVVARIPKDVHDASMVRFYTGRAQELLHTPPVTRELHGIRLLETSRTAIDRIMLLAFLYRVTGETPYAARAELEMLAVADFIDWHPEHFLDVAEMTTGVALGYDWLYDVLTPAARTTIREAIRSKGLEPVFGKEGTSAVGRTNNWNSVCNGGATLGALAIYEDAPELAERVLAVVAHEAPKGVAPYEPDGAYPEGPSYWDYGTTYVVFMIEALRFNLGTDFGLGSGPGFKATPIFMEEATGPSGKQFNYSDGSERRAAAVAMAWFGLADIETVIANGKTGRFDPLTVIWHDRAPPPGDPPLVWESHDDNPVAFLRTSRDAKHGIYVGIKAGHADAPHGHMDAGSFVLDVDGTRFASDLNKRDYDSLESAGVDYWNRKQESTRWKVFETGPFAHNVLTVNGALHRADAPALFVRHAPHPVVDLAKTLGVTKATRAFEVSDTGVVIADVIEGALAKADIRWAMTTQAAVALAGNVATLTLEGKTVRVTFEGPVKLSVEELTVNKPPYQIPIPHYRQLVAHALADAHGAAQITARFR